MTRAILALCLALSACTYPAGESCLVDAPEPRERPAEEPDCGPGWRLLWRDAGSCLILRGSGLGEHDRWSCSAALECSGDWLCVPDYADLSEGDPEDCACDFRP